MAEVDISEALTLTYIGVGAAFTVLGTLICFIMVIRFYEHLRNKFNGANRAANESEAQDWSAAFVDSESAESNPVKDAEMVAAIAAALALSIRESGSGEADSDEVDPNQLPAPSQGWRGQGRMDAFNARRMWNRGR